MAAQFLKNRLLRLLLPEDGSLHLHLCVHLKLHLDVIFSLNTDENPVHYTYIRETQEFERQRLKNNYHVGDLCCDEIFCILIAVVVTPVSPCNYTNMEIVFVSCGCRNKLSQMGRLKTSLFLPSSGGQKSKFRVAGLKRRGWQGFSHSQSSRGEFITFWWLSAFIGLDHLSFTSFSSSFSPLYL